MPQNVGSNDDANQGNVSGGSRCAWRRDGMRRNYKRRILGRKPGDKATRSLLYGGHTRAACVHVHAIALDCRLRGSTSDSIG
jgi:hypothetical protein